MGDSLNKDSLNITEVLICSGVLQYVMNYMTMLRPGNLFHTCMTLNNKVDSDNLTITGIIRDCLNLFYCEY